MLLVGTYNLGVQLTLIQLGGQIMSIAILFAHLASLQKVQTLKGEGYVMKVL